MTNDQSPLRVRFVYYDLGASTRYRIHHHAEQVRLAGGSAWATPISARAAREVRGCDLVYLHRLPLSQRTLPLLLAARRARVPVVFDSDDLVWDLRERQYNHLDAHYARREVATILLRAYRMRLLMRRVAALVFSTPYLAQLAAQTFRAPTYVSPNVAAQMMLDDACAAYAQRQRDESTVIIGYFSGTPRAHDEDLASINAALCATLERFPQVRLRLYGGVRRTGALADGRYAAQIEQRPAVDWRALPAQVAATDISIAPLIDNPQRRAKSGIKYIEAALVGVPTVAVDMQPYQMVIADGRTGLLAMTCAAWAAHLARLVEAPALRRTLGEAARTDALAAHTPAANAARFDTILRAVCERD